MLTGSGCSGGRSAAYIGDLQSNPKNKNEGFSLLASCGMFLFAKRIPGSKVSHCFTRVAVCFLSIAFRVLFIRSTNLSHSRWYAVVFSFVTPINLHTSCITLASKFIPLSDKKHSGHPNIGSSSSARSLAIHVAFLSRTANTRGHFVNRSWNTTTYLFPFAVTGNFITSTPHI